MTRLTDRIEKLLEGIDDHLRNIDDHLAYIIKCLPDDWYDREAAANATVTRAQELAKIPLEKRFEKSNQEPQRGHKSDSETTK